MSVAGLLSLFLILSIMTAMAASLATGFEGFTLGNVNGQSGWSKTGAYDVEVVANTYGYSSFGSQSLRISNGFGLGAFGDQLFSAPLADEAGETEAVNGGFSGGTRQPFFQASWDVASTVPGAEQPGLQVVASPDRGDGGRMSWVQMADTSTGLAVNFYGYDTTLGGTCADLDNFVYATITETLDRTVPHNIKITMEFMDGINDDVVKLYVDGVLVHTGKSWEDYFRNCEAPSSRTVDSVLFRVNSSVPTTMGKGFLIDNFAGYSGPISETTVVVDPSTPNWGFLEETPTGSGALVSGPGTPPTGVGSAELTIDSAGGVLFGTSDYGGTYLRDINTLTYQTYRQSGSAALAAGLQFNVDYDLTDANTGWQGRLVYEPYWTGVNPATGMWEEWDTLAADAQWWGSGAPGNTLCPQSNPCSLGEVLANWPNIGVHATIPGVVFKAGSSWGSGFVGNVDDFTIQVHGDTVHYDFEPCPGGTVTNVTSGASFCSIQAAIDAAVSGDVINVGAGTYAEVLSITTDGISLIGADEATVIINATAATSYHFTVNASDVTLKNFTLNGSPSASYGLKISGLDTATRRTGITLENITVNNTKRTGIDINGIDGVTVTNVTVNNVPSGVGLALSDVINADLDGVTTSNNAWGGTAIYTWGRFYPGGASNITLANINGSESNPLYFEAGNYHDVPNPYPITNVTLPSEYTHLVTNPDHRTDVDGANFFFFATSEANALVYADALNNMTVPVNTASKITALTSSHVSVVPSSGSSIQAAIDSAATGTMIFVGAGSYSENVTVNRHVDLIGVGSATDPAANTILHKAGNAAVVTLAASGASAADPILIQDVRIEPDAVYGINVATGLVQFVALNNVMVVGPGTSAVENEVCLKVATTASLTDVVITDSAFDGCDYGWYFAKHGDWGPGGSVVARIAVTNTTFNNNSFKGIYAEKLSDTTLTSCAVTNNGHSDFWNMVWNGGVDINLKGEEGYQNLSFVDMTVTNNGLGYKEGAGMMIKARDDGATYGAHPATLANVTIQGGTYSGNERGIRVGEPGKLNAGPTNVQIHDAEITGNVQTYAGVDGSAYGGLVNQSQAAVDAGLNWWGAANGPSGIGPGSGDAVQQAQGAAVFCPWLNAAPPAGTAVAPVTNVDTGESFCSIQAAIDDGDTVNGHTIDISAGTYAEHVVVSKSLTLHGAGAGTDSAIHTILDGTGLSAGSGIQVNNGVTDVTIEHLTVQNYGMTSSNHAGIAGVGGNNNFTVQHAQVLNNTGGRGGVYLNGPVDTVLIDNVVAHDNQGRGIVIWNGFKTHITITNNDVRGTNCCGIELQDGTASGVTMTGNTVVGNADSGMSAIGLMAGAGPNVIANNTVTNNGRFGIEIKLPNGTGLDSGDGSIVVENNTVSLVPSAGMDARDHAGIALFRRGWLTGQGYVDIPTGVIVRNNTVEGYRQENPASSSTGFGIVVEGTNSTVTGNTLNNNDVGVQVQAGHLPYVAMTSTDGDQSDVADDYFGRGNSPIACADVNSNTFSGNTVDQRAVGTTGGGTVINVDTGEIFCSIQAAIDDGDTVNGHTITIGAGTYTGAVTVNKQLTIQGAGVADVTIDASADTGYSMNVTADNVTMSGFTMLGNPAGTYGIKVSSSSPTRLQNFSLNNVKVQNSKRTGVDLNGVDGATLQHIEVTGVPSGNGLSITDCNDVTASHITTSGNAWGGFAVYTYGRYYTLGSNNISIDGTTSTFGEPIKVYVERGNFANPASPEPVTNLTVSGFAYTVGNDTFRVGAPNFTYYQRTQADAITFALALATPADSYVNEIATGDFWVGNDTTTFMTIQAAVDHAVGGEMVHVLPGIYEAQVVVPTAVTIKGSGQANTTIKSPASLTASFTSSAANYPIVMVQDVDGVVIQDLTVDGAGRGNANYRFIGIAYVDAGGEIKNVTVTDVRNEPIDGAQHGNGIFGYVTDGGPHTLKVDSSTVTGFQKNATIFAGAGLTVDVTNNNMPGAGSVAFIAQNGIQISYGATGTATGNQVSGYAYTPGNWVSTAVLVYGPGGNVTVANNTVDNSQVGIYYIDGGGVISGNSLTYDSTAMGATPYWWGIIADPGVGALSRPPAAPFDAELAGLLPAGVAAQNTVGAAAISAIATTVNDNTLEGADNGTGLEADVFGAETLDVLIDNNTVANFAVAVSLYEEAPDATLTATLTGNTLTNAGKVGTGVEVLEGTEATIGTPALGDSNDISGFATGIMIAGTATVKGNFGSIEENTVGIQVTSGGDSTILSSDIVNNDTGVLFEPGSTSSSFFCNNVTGNTVGAENQTAEEITALGVYWGDATGPDPIGSGDPIDGAFDVTPFATAPQDITCAATVPVTIGYFLAQRNGDDVVFTWQTVTETGNAGFNLLAASDAGLVQLNPELIQSKVVDALEPTDYRATFATPESLFYIQEVSVDGETDEFGPFQLGVAFGAYTAPDRIDPGEDGPTLYLPWVVAR